MRDPGPEPRVAHSLRTGASTSFRCVSSRLLPLFPLPLVLLPGAVLPLHVFEPRYRALLRDCLAGERTFGLPYLAPGTAEEALPVGHVGCVARIEKVEPLPDGRSNLVVSGGERFVLLAYAPSDAPYHVARVGPLVDEEEEATAIAAVAAQLRDRFARVARAARAIADESPEPPSLPDDPRQLAFAVGNMLDLDAADRQRLLESRSPTGRLLQHDALLGAAVGGIEERARVHARARGNGAGPQPHAP